MIMRMRDPDNPVFDYPLTMCPFPEDHLIEMAKKLNEESKITDKELREMIERIKTTNEELRKMNEENKKYFIEKLQEYHVEITTEILDKLEQLKEEEVS
jgi:uncharacterized membrane protein (DUF106 family)